MSNNTPEGGEWYILRPITPDPVVRDVAFAALAIATFGAVSLALAFQTGRTGARTQNALAAPLAALSIIVLAIWGVAAAIALGTHGTSKSIGSAMAWTVAAYALSFTAMLATAIQRRTRGGPRATRVTMPARYWITETAMLALVTVVAIVVLGRIRRDASTAVLVLVPLAFALPELLRGTLGQRFYGERLFASVDERSTPPVDALDELQAWTDSTAGVLGLDDVQVRVLGSDRTAIVPRWRKGRYLVVINDQMYAALDADTRRALVAHELAHELAHAEHAADRRAAEIVGDRRLMIRTLQRLAALRGVVATRQTRSHPSLARRIAALES